MVSIPVVPKLSPNHVGIGSRTERLRVLKRRKLKNSLRFSFLLLVTRWSADRLNLVLCYKNWFDITGFDVTFVDNLIKQDEMYIPALKKKVPVFYYYD